MDEFASAAFLCPKDGHMNTLRNRLEEHPDQFSNAECAAITGIVGTVSLPKVLLDAVEKTRSCHCHRHCSWTLDYKSKISSIGRHRIVQQLGPNIS